MRDHDTRRLDTFGRVRDFFADNIAILAKSARGQQLVASLIALIGQLRQFFATQTQGRGEAQNAAKARAEARASLRDRLEAMARTAQILALDHSGLDRKFKVPRGNGEHALLAAAKAFADAAQPLVGEFVKHGMADDFLTGVAADVAAIGQAAHDMSTARDKHVAARASITQATKKGMEILRALNAIVRNQIGKDPVGLAKWRSACHLERRNSVDATPSPTPAPMPSPAPQVA
ncbi:MAG TPA: hypothetical protein VFA59_11305 [Vicinamibacterales bacterium]|nr:hypothetical protein [Vicinamibacterales bacterium]